MINTRVHDHGPDEGPGIACVERALDEFAAPGRLVRRGQCLEDDGCSRGAHDSVTLVKRYPDCLEGAWGDVADSPGLVELEATPRRVALVAVLTDLMAVLDVELDELAEVRRTTDRQIASDAEHVMDKLGSVWAAAAEARTATRSSDLGYLPLPEAL